MHTTTFSESHRPHRAPRGFSLPELLLVIVIVGIMAGFAAPRINLAKFRLDGAVREVASYIVASKSKALLKQYDVVLLFDEPGNVIRILTDENNNGATDPGETIRTVEFGDGVIFGRGGAPALPGGGATITFKKKVDGLPSLRFHRNGSASEEGLLYLTSQGAANGGYPEHARAIGVERATGQVRCWSYATLVWKDGC
jgi:prepilin-type N-terminal cleavage/methylation domain-containing protein